MHRDLHYAIERAVTNVGLRTISTALVIEEMYGGTRTIYVDYTGDDAIAHHTGPERIEAIDALDGIDRAIGPCSKPPAIPAAPTGWSFYPITARASGPPSSSASASRSRPRSPACCGLDDGRGHHRGGRIPAGMGRRIAAEFGRGSGVGPLLALDCPGSWDAS